MNKYSRIKSMPGKQKDDTKTIISFSVNKKNIYGVLFRKNEFES